MTWLASRPLACLAPCLAVLLLTGCKDETAPGAKPLTDVGVEVISPSNLPLMLSYPGHTAGSREVEVRARVSGILLARRFEEGKPVKQDQVLFEIDAEPARAAVAQSQAELAVAKAQAAQAKRDRERIVAMSSQGLVSQVQLDQAVSASEIAEANALAAQARLRKAELDLSYCQVRAPIAGLASNEARSEGSLVTAGSETSLLTRIVQADPLYIEFTVPDAEATPLRAAAAKKQLVAHIELSDGAEYPEPAVLGFLDNAVEASSGSVAARAVLSNTHQNLLPGQFVRVRIEGVQLESVIGIPRRAVLSGDTGYFVWTLDGDNKAQRRQVALGVTVGDRVVIKRGLASGDRIVIDGVSKVAAGESVNVVLPAVASTSDRSMGPRGGSGTVKSLE